MIHKKYILPVILVIIFLKQLLFVAVIPPWQNYDEGAHFSYVQYLVEEGRMPSGQKDEGKQASFSQEYVYSRISLLKERLYSVPLQDIQTKLDQQNRHPLYSSAAAMFLDQASRPAEGSRATWRNPAASYPPAYYLLTALPYKIFQHQSIVTRLYAMRIVSSLLFLVTMLFGYLIAWRLTKNRIFSLTLVSLIGWLPVFSYTSAGVNNDVLLVTLATMAIYLCLTMLDNLNWKNSLSLGIILGLGLLTKPQWPVFLLVAGWPFLIHIWRQGIPVKKIVRYFILTMLVALLIGGWWYGSHYSSLMATVTGSASNQTSGTMVNLSPTTNYAFLTLYRWLYIFITFFFTVNFDYIFDVPYIFVILGTVLSILAVGGLIYATIAGRKKTDGKKLTQTIVLVSSIIFLEMAYLYLFLKNSIQGGFYEFPIDGRYLFPVIVPILYYWLKGLAALVPARYQAMIFSLLVAMMVTNTVWFIGFVLTPFYYSGG
jgi:4-amino-4-deoxy-L-arabinose transferase-like glycosyltransferase